MSSNPPQSSFANSPDPPGPTPLGPLNADELLPPVEPPSAGFILQLFVIPAVIVLAVVLLGMLVTSLANTGERDPAKIVATLRSSSQNRWQEAFELANALRNEQQNPELKNNSDLASQLAQLLDEEITSGNADDGSVKLRSFLCSALGEFHVDDGVEVLLRAAREDPDTYVRGSAINSLAILAEDFRMQDPPREIQDKQFVDTFVELSNDQNDAIRSQTAYALGVITLSNDSDPRLDTELETLVDDLHADARYNAALALARHGNVLAVAAVAEMVDLKSLAVTTKDSLPQAQLRKRNTIIKNALDAAVVIHDKNPAADLSQLSSAVQNLIDEAAEQSEQVPPQLVDRAQEVLGILSN
ncbi:HEAT repeat domain-containing protein [Bythopirellula polymerisocia]|uniref:HEAT repeat protein n=1 Tax=Bythopirellula polymerisocia TaxID=2528003 RepID=A0A5C6CZT9_9BACT|nr:HEAT repeat domain-containing protein [Bythopirellula polymerisocia]TWU30110.1 HEAT repeat protein [Bythopirellula polymerisocia]